MPHVTAEATASKLQPVSALTNSMPAGTESTMATPVASFGPALEAVSVYVTSWKRFTVEADAAFAMLRSACGATTIAAASVLLVRSGSWVEVDAVALLVTVVPAALAVDARDERHRVRRGGGDRPDVARDRDAERRAVRRRDERQAHGERVADRDVLGGVGAVVRHDERERHLVADGRRTHARPLHDREVGGGSDRKAVRRAVVGVHGVGLVGRARATFSSVVPSAAGSM